MGKFYFGVTLRISSTAEYMSTWRGSLHINRTLEPSRCLKPRSKIEPSRHRTVKFVFLVLNICRREVVLFTWPGPKSPLGVSCLVQTYVDTQRWNSYFYWLNIFWRGTALFISARPIAFSVFQVRSNIEPCRHRTVKFVFLGIAEYISTLGAPLHISWT